MNYNGHDHDNQLDFEPAEPFNAIPYEVLPETISEFVKAGAKSIGCDPSYIVLPLLSVTGSAIGNTRRLIAKSDWEVPP